MTEDILVGVNTNKRGINEVIADLNKLGFELKQILEHIHVVYGSLDTKQLSAAKKIAGIYSIEFDKIYGIKDEE